MRRSRGMSAMRRGAPVRGSLLLATAVVVGAILGTLAVFPRTARAATLYVGGGGPGNYTTIQAAIDAASPGDTIFVYAGVYAERILVPKALDLVGQDRDTTVIDGAYGGDVVHVTAGGVSMTGFTVNRSDGSGAAGIYVDGVSGGRFVGNVLADNWGSGIRLRFSTGVRIEDNTFRDNVDPDGAGIFLEYSDGNRIANNSATGGADGVRLEFSARNVVTGNNLSTNWDYGVLTAWAGENRVENNSLFDNWGRGVYAVLSDRNVIRNNTLIQNLRGIELSRSLDNLVTENVLNETWDYGILLSESSGNRVSRNALVSTYADAVTVFRASRETIDNNTFRGSSYADVNLYTSVGIKVADNTMTRGVRLSWGASANVTHWNTHDILLSNIVNGRPVYYGRDSSGGVVPPGMGQVLLANTTGVTVENQTFGGVVVGVEAGFGSGAAVSNVTGQDNLVGIVLYSHRSAVVQNAAFGNASRYGLQVVLSESNVVRNATFPGGTSYGIVLESSNWTTLESVNASGGMGTGLWLYFSTNVTVDVGVFSQRLGQGVVATNSDDLSISRLTVADNSRDGVLLWASDLVTIRESAFAGNRVGVNVTNAVGIKVFHNDFLGNVRQAVAWGANLWDDGYPSGGNYWSDYAGADVFQGPNQDIPGSDGIGDTPYVIDADSADRYPLMARFTQDRPAPPPTVRAAVLAGAGLADVALSWDLSADDGAGENDVAGYEVWSGTAYDATGASYTLLASVPAGTTSYVHAGAGYGDSVTHFYQVRAVEAGTGRTAASDVQAAKRAGVLPAGWALFSIPLLQAGPAIAVVLQTVSFDVVRTYRASDPADPWKVYRMGQPGDLTAVEWGDGLWVRLVAPGDLAVAGLVVPSPAFLLRPGWNLVAYASPIPRTLAASLAGVPGVVRVETYDPMSSDPYRLRVADPVEMLIPGGAYWILVEGSGGVWVQG